LSWSYECAVVWDTSHQLHCCDITKVCMIEHYTKTSCGDSGKLHLSHRLTC